MNYYNETPPYHPDEMYPEYPFENCLSHSSNPAYRLVRNIFVSMGLDNLNFGKKNWNPLGDIIKPNDTVLLKPNFVTHQNWAHQSGLTDTLSLITHGSVIRAVLDYVYIALQGKGRIMVGDAPLQSANFEKILELSQLQKIQEFHRKNGIGFEIIDFRLKHAEVDDRGDLKTQTDATGYKGGYIAVNIGKDSLHMGLKGDFETMRVANYDPSKMLKHHNKETHEYIIPKAIFEADVIINLPKLKSHIKAGLTASLKNLIGINGHKDWLPHHRKGAAEKGGDEYKKHDFFKSLYVDLDEKEWSTNNLMLKKIYRQLKRIPQQIALRSPNNDGFYQGGWHGNDTIWRTTLDLNRILFYSDKNGNLIDNIERRYLSIIDGIIGGEKQGPLSPSPIECGIMLAGYNPIVTDLGCACYMSFDYTKIPTINNASTIKKYPLVNYKLENSEIIFNDVSYSPASFVISEHVNPFIPGTGWMNYIESGQTKS